MDIVSAANINAAVTYVAALIIKTEYVSGFNGIKFNMHAVLCLSRCSTV